MSQDGVEIFTNSSASHHELRKADLRVNLIKSATTKVVLNRSHKMYLFHEVITFFTQWDIHISQVFLWALKKADY